jgi:hypothetical protein
MLIVHALTEYSHSWEEVNPSRSQRTDELIEAIANEQGISSVEMLEQMDLDWPEQPLH